MKKRLYIKLLTMAIASALLTGCSYSFIPKKDDASEEISKDTFDQTTEDATEEASKEILEETEDVKESLSGEELYNAFMNGEVKVVYHNLSNEEGDSLKNYLEEGKEYDINEIIKNIEDNQKTVVKDPEYVFIDCGEDGITELLVKIEFEEAASLSMILKDIDGELRICYSGEEWVRNDLSVSDIGIISSAGSGGATVHGYDNAFVNADGEYKFFYSCSTEGNPYSYYANTSDNSYEVISFEDLDTEYFMINCYCVKDDNGIPTYYYNYDMLDEDYNIITTDDDFDSSNPYMKKFIDAGITVYTKAEIDDIMAKRVEEIGYPGVYQSESEVADDSEK